MAEGGVSLGINLRVICAHCDHDGDIEEEGGDRGEEAKI